MLQIQQAIYLRNARIYKRFIVNDPLNKPFRTSREHQRTTESSAVQ
jgi:hypothetical protein